MPNQRRKSLICEPRRTLVLSLARLKNARPAFFNRQLGWSCGVVSRLAGREGAAMGSGACGVCEGSLGEAMLVSFVAVR